MLIDLSRCPKCNGPSDNGHDREVPPNPYYCTKCMAEPTTEDSFAVEPGQEPVADRAAFERHAQRLGYSVDPDTREGREGGYWSSHTHLMWETWQAAMAEPVQEPVAQISANRVIAAIEEWKSLWWKVPPFASKVNRATREAITVSHNPLFALLLDAQAAKQMPKGCTTPSGCQQHGCHGECLPTEPQRPAEPVQEPAGQLQEEAFGRGQVLWFKKPPDLSMLYTAPPQRKPLSEEEKRALADKFLFYQPESYEVSGVFDLISAIERVHGIGGQP